MIFELEGVELERVQTFQAEHANRHRHVDVSFAYRFTPSGIGTTIIIKCGHCLRVRNCTNYESW